MKRIWIEDTPRSKAWTRLTELMEEGEEHFLGTGTPRGALEELGWVGIYRIVEEEEGGEW